MSRATQLVNMIAVCVLMTGAATSAQEIGRIDQIKPMHLQTQLVLEGRPKCAIAVPDGQPYQRLAEQIAAAVNRQCGAEPAIVPAAGIHEMTLLSRNVIALGIFCFNELTERLYRTEYVLCDYSWPEGEDSYVIRTVHNPWLAGTNVIFIGSAHPAGLERAVGRFTEIVAEHPDGVLGPIIEVSGDDLPESLDAQAVAAEEQRIQQETSSRTMGGLAAGHADSYFRSGKPEYARLFLAAMRKLDELHAAEGAADDVRTCRYIFHQFDRIEEGPAFTDKEREELTNLFYRFAHRLRYANTDVQPSEMPHGNNWNATGAAFAGMYFSRYYPNLEIGQRLLENLDTYYEPNMTNWKVNEDCPGYGDITLTGNYKWALHRPDERYIDQDHLRRMADYDMLITDNTGRVSGFGDASGLGGKYLVNALPLAAWLYQDGRYLWWWDHHGGQRTRFWVPPEVLERQRPDDLLGVSVAPLAEWIYERDGYEDVRRFPREDCFDKASFRAGFRESREYLCLSGFGYGFHSHPDANAIVRFQDEGEIFLYDDGYMIPSLSEHNSIIVLKDGWAGRVPELAEVTANANFATVGIFESRLSGYNGVRWDRCVIWPRGRYFLVIDELQAEEPGSYDFQCIYRTLGDGSLRGRHWTARKGEAQMTLIAASDASLSQKQSAGTSLNAKPFAMNEARRLIEAAGRPMQPDDRCHFANLFYATPAAPDARMVDMVQIGDSGQYIIDDGGEMALAGVGHSAAVGGLIIDADAFYYDSETLAAAGAETVRIEGPLLEADAPVDLRIDLQSGEAAVVAHEPTTVTFQARLGEERESLGAGRHDLLLHGIDRRVRVRIATDLQTHFEELATAAEAEERPEPGMAEGIERLWEYSDFDVYRDFTDVTGATVTVNARHFTPDEAGYPVGEPPDLLEPGGNVMFPDGETLILDLDLLEPRELTQIVVHSRQLRTFNGGCGVSRLTAWVGNDQELSDADLAGTMEIAEPLQNAKMTYAIEPEQPVTGRYVRIEAIPWSDQHNVYLDSIQLNGKGRQEDIIESGFHMNALEVADIDGDGRHEAFAGGSDRAVHAIGPDGSGLWKYRVGDVINDLTVAGADDGGTQIVAGCDDKTLYSVTEAGAESWTLLPPPRTYARPGYRGVEPFQGRLTVVFDSDLDLDGDDEIIVGSANWRTYVYDHGGDLLWDEVLWAHTPTCGTAHDLDGDGRQELIMGNSYTATTIYSAGGEILGNGAGSGHAGPTDVAAADLDGNGAGEMVTGDRAGMIWFQEWKGRDLPDYNAGSDITSVEIADLTGDGRLEAVVASKNFLLYLFDADGQPLWQTNLRDVARDIQVADVTGDERPEIVCACEDGTVKAIDAEGEVVAWYQAGAWVRQVRVCELDGDAATAEIVATCDDGRIYGLRVTR
ncbi:MAG: hypothetical protein U9R79_14660 [Armatimonadota bacterium]|nr:hypothetical protein [Armatimonadota bacterium]